MSFTTIEFMFRFLPIFLIVYYVVPTRYKNMILLIGSFVFYAWGQHFYLLLLMLSIVVNYTFGRLIGERRAQKKLLLVLGLIYNFGLLVFFKYTNFFIENIKCLADGNACSDSNHFCGHAVGHQLLYIPSGFLLSRCLSRRPASG